MTEITQTDRDAAAEHIPAMGMANSVINGKSDNHTLVQAFSQHRMEERAAIVAWLRGDDPYPDGHDIADAIEAGEHLKCGGNQ